jgi:hypothetical protein
MSNIIRPGAGILFMKVGTHAQETLEDIIARKTKEIEDAGYALWGYGGNTCHPQTMVQPFARSYEERGHTIYLCMQEMVSKHSAEPMRADQLSEDGITWKDIPKAINVLGSRYALPIKRLHMERLELPLAQTRVAIGSSQGRAGDQYISGRVDKACLEVTAPTNEKEAGAHVININLVAELIRPYAVYVRFAPS